MKLKVVIVDLEVSPRAKKWCLRAGIPLALLVGGGAIAWASPPHAFSDGQILTAQELNDNFTALDARLTVVEGQVHAPSAFRAVRTTAFNTPANATTTVVFDNVLFDLDGEYNVATGAFVPKNAGTYLIACSFDYLTPGVAEWSAILFDGATELVGTDMQSSTGGAYSGPETVILTRLAAGDSITCRTFQNSGVSQPLAIGGSRNTFSAARLY